MGTFKWELQKGSKHIACPSCGKKTFKPYVSAADGKTFADAEKYGRCERINSCGYLAYPNPGGDDFYFTPPPPEPPLPPSFVPPEIVEKTFFEFRRNPFFLYMVKLFGSEKAYELQEMYNIGTAKNGGTIFWQQDKDGNFRTGKVFYYDNKGKRRKDRPSWFLHRKIDPEFNLQQVLFGEHLTPDAQRIALVESEKTAILMSAFHPSITWVAAGGAQMLNLDRLGRLPRLDEVYPDAGQFDLWRQKTHLFEERSMNYRVEKAAKDGVIPQGADVLDLELFERGLLHITI